MFYTIYKTTNKINGKIYIGKHQTNNLDDGYIGSGKRLRYSINKHGKENFEKEILFIFDNEQEMNDKEKELVTEEFCLDENVYNICPGGKGGWGYVNQNEMNGFSNRETAIKGAISSNIKRREMHRKKLLCNEYKESWKKALSNSLKGKIGTFCGRKHKEETKEKMRKPKNCGSSNPNYGKMWITNGLESKTILVTEGISLGWKKGRKMS